MYAKPEFKSLYAITGDIKDFNTLLVGNSYIIGRQELARYYSEYTSGLNEEALRYQKRIRELESTLIKT